METVPLQLASLVVQDPAERALVETCGRRVGSGVELDLTRLAESGHEPLAARIRAYAADCYTFWDALDSDETLNLRYVATRRLVLHDKQRDTKTEKRFLVPQVRAFQEVSATSEYTKALLAQHVDDEALSSLGKGLAANVVQDGHWRTIDLLVEGVDTWPAALGGMPGRAEIRRRFTLVTSHAKSKGRHDERRLVEVSVHVEEIWPTPSA